MGHVLEKPAKQAFGLCRRAPGLPKKFLKEPLFEKPRNLGEQAEEDLIDEVGDSLRRMATPTQSPASSANWVAASAVTSARFFVGFNASGFVKTLRRIWSRSEFKKFFQFDRNHRADDIVPVGMDLNPVGVARQ